MAKTNFTKVEGMLDEGLRKMMVDYLLEATDAQNPESTKTKTDPAKQKNLRLKLLSSLQRDMKILDTLKQEPYELFNITKKKINGYVKNFDKLTTEEWEGIKELQLRVHHFRKEQEKNSTQINDSDIIEKQRRSQKTKRININDTWLPLS